jgi:hypothetical protein
MTGVYCKTVVELLPTCDITKQLEGQMEELLGKVNEIVVAQSLPKEEEDWDITNAEALVLSCQ